MEPDAKPLREVTANDIAREYFAYVLTGSDRVLLFSLTPEPNDRHSENTLVRTPARRVTFD